jgi:1-acyl-sn-glycerol-3-phosphate acyltransferase
MRTVICFVWLALSLLVCLPASLYIKLIEKKASPEEYNRAVFKFTSWWARTLVKVSGARLHITGWENIPRNETVLYVSNHQSDFDIVVFLAVSPIPIGFVAKIEMLKVPFMRTWMKQMHSIFIDRKDIRQTAKVMLDGINILKEGQSLVLFPEGSRSKSRETQPFKLGGLKLATKSGVTVVPVTVDGSYNIVEGNHYKITPSDVYMHFHPAIRMSGLDDEAMKAMPAQVEETITDWLDNSPLAEA